MVTTYRIMIFCLSISSIFIEANNVKKSSRGKSNLEQAQRLAWGSRVLHKKPKKRKRPVNSYYIEHTPWYKKINGRYAAMGALGLVVSAYALAVHWNYLPLPKDWFAKDDSNDVAQQKSVDNKKMPSADNKKNVVIDNSKDKRADTISQQSLPVTVPVKKQEAVQKPAQQSILNIIVAKQQDPIQKEDPQQTTITDNKAEDSSPSDEGQQKDPTDFTVDENKNNDPTQQADDQGKSSSEQQTQTETPPDVPHSGEITLPEDNKNGEGLSSSGEPNPNSQTGSAGSTSGPGEGDNGGAKIINEESTAKHVLKVAGSFFGFVVVAGICAYLKS